LAYGSNFVALALLTSFLGGSFYVRQIVVTVMVCMWGARLAGYLFMRIIKIGNDNRFDNVRENAFKFGVWFFLQYVTIWAIALPYILLNAQTSENPPLRANDWVGWVLFAIGLVSEAVGDHQKFVYKNNKANKDHWCDTGLWKYSRHPNYFGELCVWWGLFMSCASVITDYEWFTIGGPLYITVVLLFGSGIPTTEKSTDKRYWSRPEYQEYKQRTPVLIPFVPGVFGGVAKTLFCCEWPLFNYPPKPEDEKQKIVVDEDAAKRDESNQTGSSGSNEGEGSQSQPQPQSMEV